MINTNKKQMEEIKALPTNSSEDDQRQTETTPPDIFGWVWFPDQLVSYFS